MNKYNRRYKKAFNPCINAEEVLEKLELVLGYTPVNNDGKGIKQWL